ncbi:hypothetical protein [Enterobacter ludwigii]|uniref:hypothetical protein n=1 Tax=Enterobacter ludwigii TaxID=299767 RepID=UPI0006436B4A|nr:hypothetical protein [Enterobacter ludwigii]KLP41765.1 hypothetical protein ABR36_07945 [Enterobacter ludwigii]
MKAKYATLIRRLLQNYHCHAKAIDKDNFSIHSDGLQLMELNIQLAKCLEGISSTARFNNDNDNDDFDELHKITLMVFGGNIPTENNIPWLTSLAASALKNNNTHLKPVTSSL